MAAHPLLQQGRVANALPSSEGTQTGQSWISIIKQICDQVQPPLYAAARPWWRVGWTADLCRGGCSAGRGPNTIIAAPSRLSSIGGDRDRAVLVGPIQRYLPAACSLLERFGVGVAEVVVEPQASDRQTRVGSDRSQAAEVPFRLPWCASFRIEIIGAEVGRRGWSTRHVRLTSESPVRSAEKSP